ncbi:hypothetical protein GCM10023115_45450 [Pontixanthobacter gangjinensis]|uniref:Heat-shock protein Hsp90 n=1 Tax=Christiangramia aestuarii TaxID=1028746 RepID=A0A7M3SXN0_9FLAO|nr:DUF6503 family protein [Christiangramia aestuarii]MUP41361.1 hypothetical protein [Christiangramia aestuarii]
MKKLSFLFAFLLIISCKQNTSEEQIPVEPDNGIGDGATPPKVFSFSENIEEAHNKAAFMNQPAVAFDINLKFGGQTRLEGRVTMTTNSTKVRVDKADGSSIIYDGEKVFMSPDTSEAKGARFDIFTWQYFFAMPFKLTDPGTVWEEQQPKMLDSISYDTAKLSFKSNIGDSPDDWYVVYKDQETNRLKAAAYIVTFSKEKEKAEEDPHAIVYSDFKSVENVDIATKWSFHNWNSEDGFGEKLGEATISNIRFFDPKKDYFKAPEKAQEVTK